MCILNHRLQILLDEQQYRELKSEARRCQSSVAAVIREAIDHRTHSHLDRRQAALKDILAAEPVELPDDPSELRRELDAAHARALG